MVRAQSKRYIQLSRGFHWLCRVRAGGLMLTSTARKAKLLIDSGPGAQLGKCIICKSRTQVDSIEHFMFECKHPDLCSIRDSIDLDRVSRLIVKISLREAQSAKSGAVRIQLDPHSARTRSTLLLGGKECSVSASSVSKARVKAGALSSSEQETLDAIHGSTGWRRARVPLLAVSFKLSATFLQRAMPVRNRMMWPRLQRKTPATTTSTPPRKTRRPSGGSEGQRPQG